MSSTTNTKKKSKIKTVFLVVRNLIFNRGDASALVVGAHQKKETAYAKVSELDLRWLASDRDTSRKILGITRVDHWIVPITVED